MKKVFFVTGASKGIGLEIARAALAAGDKVVATVRSNPDRLVAALGNHPDLFVVTMDVTKEDQVQGAVNEAIAHFGKLDVLVNNAGYGMVSAIEEASNEEVRKQYDTNVFGLLNVTRAVLPFFRKQRSGHVINISSLFGFDSIAGWALYGSTKFAVEGISKGLALELAPLGIHVTAVEPGLFSTDFLNAESYTVAKNVIGDYKDTAGVQRGAADYYHGKQPGDPVKLARVIAELAHNDNPPLHLPLGTDAVNMYRKNAEKTSREIDQWQKVSYSTDHQTVNSN